MKFQHTAARRRLGLIYTHRNKQHEGFNTQPPEGGWDRLFHWIHTRGIVSTHSRPKAAGKRACLELCGRLVSTHSRPKAAGALKTLCMTDM